ncbi:DUF551 domain-containing protein [Budviciaceae bacterium CWB-B4]|uniref:DUF551 domain-containing protein n=1 Tax=Limnobaculum xujianqingii TaxID=2738837 RepID=A0A9D7AK86_9GAMM|nr:DUF551 domain-containing protein [Limnobaculum xujianqingii]MBK5074603.1 DUF551 domain-containing protein [Limnobaculum xujianqingii]MBK5177731.1 DUF551 domain-containing protein [Limnobaculum xujianqingii]
MIWISVNQRLPEPLTKVWVKTNTGKQTTGYVKNNGEWHLFCRRIAADNPVIVEWGE